MKQLRIYNNYPQGVESHKDLVDYILNKTKGLKIVLHNTVDSSVRYVDTTPPPPIDYSKVAMFFENVGTDDAVISIQKNSKIVNTASLETSTDNTNWETWGETSTTALSKTLGAGKRLYIRNANDVGYIHTFIYNCYNYFSSTGANIIVGGNIMSLGYKNFENEYTIEQSCAYSDLFRNMTKLVDASRLVLPATTLADGCYGRMFQGCTSLTTAPSILPATQLVESCYNYMFNGCTSLTTAPELPATTLAEYCYSNMFQYCSSLTTVPELPATTLVFNGYNSMFSDCTSLTTVPELPATQLADNCCVNMFKNCTSLTTAPKLLATKLANNCYINMFSGCTSLTTVPELPATTLASSCYNSMFYGCTSLTTAPELPATTLASGCYQNMFYGCSNLNYIKAMFTTTPSTSYTQNWVSGVSSTGTFVKNANATWDVSGDNGIPTGWDVETATA